MDAERRFGLDNGGPSGSRCGRTLFVTERIHRLVSVAANRKRRAINKVKGHRTQTDSKSLHRQGRGSAHLPSKGFGCEFRKNPDDGGSGLRYPCPRQNMPKVFACVELSAFFFFFFCSCWFCCFFVVLLFFVFFLFFLDLFYSCFWVGRVGVLVSDVDCRRVETLPLQALPSAVIHTCSPAHTTKDGGGSHWTRDYGRGCRTERCFRLPPISRNKKAERARKGEGEGAEKGEKEGERGKTREEEEAERDRQPDQRGNTRRSRNGGKRKQQRHLHARQLTSCSSLLPGAFSSSSSLPAPSPAANS